ncbi:MAG: SusC/RagA family TonB-linked outer membrane protein [Dysgonomonas sp.]|nr:SusC/RagA family TonB-linked outer membrane protein [Dysgonomonas sp.]
MFEKKINRFIFCRSENRTLRKDVKKRFLLFAAAVISLSLAPNCLKANDGIVSSTPVAVNQTQQQTPAQSIEIRGIVKDTDGETLPGVTVKTKSGKGAGAFTDVDGQFRINVQNMDESLVFTFIGMKDVVLKLKPRVLTYNVTMESSDTQLESVVVEAGIIQRNKLGFTGSYTTVTQEELKSVGRINVIQTLSSLDPGFVVAENTLMGSNPNSMATITMRGGSTMDFKTELDDNTSNPNEPLFILDGFETNIETVNDLDVNRIESITLLKDAGSTAIYGSKGANGVVVIETIKPKAGQVMINYNNTFQVAAADLSQYDMMNAREKLEFERLSGRYGDLTDNVGNAPNIALYNNNLKQIAEGVDTYWLKVPIRTGITHDHSLNVSGGNKDFLYQVGMNYRNTQGVMKDSDRESFGGNARITYRNAEKKINVSNNVTISVANGHDGAWGSFSNYVSANPYYRMKDSDGTAPQMLDQIRVGADPNQGISDVLDYVAPNPYYNAKLNTFSDSRSLSIVNNTSFDWFIQDGLRWQASLSVRSTKNESESFKDPRHSDYRDTEYAKQGSYSSSYGTSWGYNANTTLSYNHTLMNAHNLTFIGRASVDEKNSESEGYSVLGFPQGVDGIPSFSYGYPEDGTPSYSQRTNRLASFLLAFNYNYNWRYVLDFNYNVDGSSAFGSNKKFQNFWNVGAAWNIHKEGFAKDWEDNLLQELKLRTSYGINGNQNVNNVSESVYRYYGGSNIFGMGSYLENFANPNLKWQVAKKLSAGLNLTMFKNRLRLTFDTYQTKTDPLVVDMTQRLSSGVSTIPQNLGHLTTKGVEFTAAYYVIRNLKDQISLNVRITGGATNSKYGGFSDKLKELNERYASGTNRENNQNINSLIKYEDGNSPSTIWAVKSLGIDPATGKEVFLTKDGQPTFKYRAQDRVAIGNTRPDIQGVFSFDFRYKKLITSMYFRYQLGAYALNRALYSRVENIGKSDIIFNQDRRALYDRWQKPGDIAQFKDIYLENYSSTPISSRFIQKDDYIKGESVKVSWDFSQDKWIKKFALKSLQVNISMTDLFIISTIKQERSFDYPFQRAISGGLSATF